ncbi:uncharacterized protein LOC119839260 [Zerene cesonia]|uniref:uncharacterized protein LOC119839260 n=1 Tax=Zerene cesonia TaxID=33412 RepID=UPI0018E53931|nr:uncharacterized protein LOC119839260 [Zerene cesonia]
MMENGKVLLPHHEQQSLCTTRLPYRQGRKLTAVKAYSITNESNHLLIFGVPSLNLRQETKALFAKFGKLLQFTISTQHVAEVFTENYHAQFEKLQSARLAKRMLDTKNFYGGCLHVCYAPEFESINETKEKLLQRKRDVIFRLRNLQMDILKEQNVCVTAQNEVDLAINSQNEVKKLNMGEYNTISMGEPKKRKKYNECGKKKSKSSVIKSEVQGNEQLYNSNQFVGPLNKCELEITKNSVNGICSEGPSTSFSKDFSVQNKRNVNKCTDSQINTDNIEIVDCTSVDMETVTNINEHLNYNKFGNEVIRRVPVKPLNKIKFNFNKS